MCGIAGIVGDRDPERLSRMLDAIVHRGPDDCGQQWFHGPGVDVGLGNRRLAILDLSSAGHQPMARDGYGLVYNGEAYNFRALRRELEDLGESLFSGTDTEVVFALLRRGGASALRRINGMFALAFWSSHTGELLLARDRFGQKPLYYARVDGNLVFASEIKALYAAGLPRRLEPQLLPAYLSFGWVPGDESLVRGVSQVPAGSVLKWRNGAVSIDSFHDVTPRPQGLGRDEAAHALRAALKDAVRRQLDADVPVGVLLSGGLDSTTIAALAAVESSKPVKAYTIAFRPEDSRLEQNSSDAAFARTAARELGLDLAEFEASPRIAELLETAAFHLDDPVADPAAMLTYLISQEARQHVKVLLSGQGSDELFAGYRAHGYAKASLALEHLPRRAALYAGRIAGAVPRMTGRLPNFLRPGLVRAAARATEQMLSNLDAPIERRYIGYRSAYYFGPSELTALLTSATHDQSEAWAVHLRSFLSPSLPLVDRMLHVDAKTFLVDQNLAYSDRMSMAASIEMRVPFLDDAVADLALAMPPNLKLRRFEGKAILRDAVRDIVPKPILDRRKAGFGAPIRTWLMGDLKPYVRDRLSEPWLRATGLFEPATVEVLLDEHERGLRDHTYRIWTLLTLAVWWDRHGITLA